MDRKAFSVRPLYAESDEKAFWAQKSPLERLEALEQMRQILYGYDPATPDFKELLQLLNENQVEYPSTWGEGRGSYLKPRRSPAD